MGVDATRSRSAGGWLSISASPKSSWWLKTANSAGRRNAAPCASCSSTATRPPGPGWGTAEGDAEAKGSTCSTARAPSAASCGAGSRSCGSRRPRASGSGTAERRSPMAPRWHCCIWAEGVSDEYQSGGGTPWGGPAKGLKAADRGRYLGRSGIQVEDAEGADRQMQQCPLTCPRQGTCRSVLVVNAAASGTRHGGPWRGAWPAESLDPQLTVEGSYGGQLGPYIRSPRTCGEQGNSDFGRHGESYIVRTPT